MEVILTLNSLLGKMDLEAKELKNKRQKTDNRKWDFIGLILNMIYIQNQIYRDSLEK
jgi:hypothetical protein